MALLRGILAPQPVLELSEIALDLGSFSSPLGQQTSFYAEIYGLILAIEYAHSKGWNAICLECDSTSAIACLKNPDPSLEHLNKGWLNSLSLVKSMRFHLSHIFIAVADSLANLGLSYSSLTWWNDPPDIIKKNLFEDAWGKYRFCS